MKNTKDKSVDMLHGALWLPILVFAMPLAASSILQQLFNAADVAVVGRFAGGNALAAVGSNSSIISLFVNSFVGLAVGANVMIAQQIGRNDTDKTSDVVHTSILFAILMGVALLFVGITVARPLLRAISTPDEVMDQAVLYLRVYMLGTPFAVVYNFGAAVLRSIGDTKRPMYCLIISGILNVFLNLLFVIVFHMGVAGVALATSISNVVSCAAVVVILHREQSVIHLDFRKLRIKGWAIKRILLIGGPAAIQSIVFSISNICIQGGINMFGTNAIAGSAAALNFEYFDYFMVSAFNQAAVTFIGQNFAAGKYDRCNKIFKICMTESLCAITAMLLMFWFFRGFWLNFFTTDPAVVEYAVLRMSFVLLPHMLICTYEITGSVLRGMGKSMLPAVITIIGTVGFRLFWLATVFQKWHSYETIMRVYPVSWIITGSIMITAYIVMRRKLLSCHPEELSV